MADAQKGHKSWIERVDQPPDAGAHDSRDSGSGAAPAPVSGQGGDADPAPATWLEYLDSSPEPTPAPFRSPQGNAKQTSPTTQAPGQRQQAVPNPDVTELQRRWLFTQAQLLDDPKEAVLEAGRLIGHAMRLASDTVDKQRNRIEREWRTDADVDTDELRSVMQRYRGLFQYVLAADGLVGEVEAVRREHKAAAAAHTHTPAATHAAPPQDGLAEVLQPGRAARYDTEVPDHHRPWRESGATRWIAGLGTSWKQSRKTRWVAGAALLLLVGLPTAYGLWRWQQSSAEEAARQARALTVEPLRYPWHEQSSRALAPQADQELGNRVAAGTEAGLTSPAAAAQSQQREAIRPPAGEPRPTVEEPTPAAQPADEQSAIRQAEREPEPVTPEPQPATRTEETASLTDEETQQTDPATLLTETAPAPQDSTQTPVDQATASAQQATSTPLQSTDPSQTQSVAGAPESTPAQSRPAASLPEATAGERTPSVRQTAPTGREPAPQPKAAEPAVRRGDLVPLSDPGVARPVLLVEPRAEYPAAARRMRREATVALRVLVDERGTPTQIQPAGQSAGLGFDEAARAAVERARWRPATKDGVPVKVWIQTAVRFQLDGR